RNLGAAGYCVYTASGLEPAMRVLERTPVDLIVTDLKMTDGDGLELIRFARENLNWTEVMLVTGYASVDGAVEALQKGAAEYLVKPYTQEELLAAVERALARLRMRKTAHDAAAIAAPAPSGLIAESESMSRVFAQITRAAPTDATVLITGESGTGKELVARATHYGGSRRSAPFVPVSCGAIPEALLESELFGHVRGAFTGADRNRTGFFQAAEHGTIFLDEISETSPGAQLKLLRVLEDGEVYMVGSSQPRYVDVRVVAATNKSLPQLVEQGTFRDDLFYRINVLSIEVPPLRKRGDDILLLVAHFAAKYSDELGRAQLRFSDSALEALMHYSWPGNVRELQNLVQQMVVMKEDDLVDLPDLPSSMKSGFHPRGENRSLAQVEADHIRSVLANVNGNKARAARILGIDRKTLYGKIARYGIGTA
ncbi:sigma-54-dependent transcriptional regulator, partial [Gemmatimonadota bacterium]